MWQVESGPSLYTSGVCSPIRFSHLHFPEPSLLYGIIIIIIIIIRVVFN